MSFMEVSYFVGWYCQFGYEKFVIRFKVGVINSDIYYKLPKPRVQKVNFLVILYYAILASVLWYGGTMCL